GQSACDGNCGACSTPTMLILFDGDGDGVLPIWSNRFRHRPRTILLRALHKVGKDMFNLQHLVQDTGGQHVCTEYFGGTISADANLTIDLLQEDRVYSLGLRLRYLKPYIGFKGHGHSGKKTFR
ncbi:unnamed protein product, partial [Discosporangium mesarthrocarpum]